MSGPARSAREAEHIWLGQNSGKVVPAHLVAYDFETGFGLVQAMGPLDAKPLPFGNSDVLRLGEVIGRKEEAVRQLAASAGLLEARSEDLDGKHSRIGRSGEHLERPPGVIGL